MVASMPGSTPHLIASLADGAPHLTGGTPHLTGGTPHLTGGTPYCVPLPLTAPNLQAFYMNHTTSLSLICKLVCFYHEFIKERLHDSYNMPAGWVLY